MNRVVVISYGSIGRRHVANLRAHFPDVAVAVLRRPESNHSDGPPDGVAVFTSMADVLAWGPDAAVVCSPATQHVAQGMALVEAGVHLLMEKPLSHDSEGVDALVAAARAANVVAVVAYVLRFHRPIAALRQAWVDGKAGEGRYVRAHIGMHLPDWRPWRPVAEQVSAQRGLGGGALLELSHEIDLVCWLFGRPRTVFARLGAVGGHTLDVEDLAELTLSWDDGRIASIHLDMLDRQRHRSVRLVGAESSLSWSLDGDSALWQGPDMVTTTLDDGEGWAFADAYIEELRHFAACIDGTESSRCTLEEAATALAVIDAARRSAESRREEPV